MKPTKKSISITLDYPIIEEIQNLAGHDDRSVSSYINIILRDHLKHLDDEETTKAPE